MADPEPQQELVEEVGKKEARKLKARRQKPRVWFGLGMMGMIGWSVALPMALGALLGHELDRHYPRGQISWTLSGLLLGAIVGCLHAWYWIERNRRDPPDLHESTSNEKGEHHGDS